ncbi:MAG: glycogen/starch/alpha-glucan phosphorylase, partial [Rubrivivax sp.]
MKTSSPRSLSKKGAGMTTPDLPARPRKAATAPAARASGGGMTAAERAEFVRTWKRELSQRSDATSASARSSAAAAAARTVLADRWALTQAADARRGDRRRVHYLSMEFLMGRAMHNALAALKVDEHLPELLGAGAPGLTELVEHEPDAALGNGGLGRLAACFLDSFA